MTVSEDVVSELSRYIKSPALISITGGGGKTTLMFALARSMSARGARVVVSTTTKIFVPSRYEGGRLIVGLPDIRELGELLGREGILTLGSSLKDGKLIGSAPEAVDRIYSSGVADCVIVESDGARGMPFKAYESYEPVIPLMTTFHIAVVGAEIFKEPMTDANTFRAELLRERWGAQDSAQLPFELIVKLLESDSEYLKSSPPSALRALVINKSDLLSPAEITELTDMLCSSLRSYDFVSVCSLKAGSCSAFVSLKRHKGEPT